MRHTAVIRAIHRRRGRVLRSGRHGDAVRPRTGDVRRRAGAVRRRRTGLCASDEAGIGRVGAAGCAHRIPRGSGTTAVHADPARGIRRDGRAGAYSVHRRVRILPVHLRSAADRRAPARRIRAAPHRRPSAEPSAHPYDGRRSAVGRCHRGCGCGASSLACASGAGPVAGPCGGGAGSVECRAVPGSRVDCGRNGVGAILAA